ncbi:MAG: hypothetical protein U0Z53_08095 [Blastocatellia bacterium]
MITVKGDHNFTLRGTVGFAIGGLLVVPLFIAFRSLDELLPGDWFRLLTETVPLACAPGFGGWWLMRDKTRQFRSGLGLGLADENPEQGRNTSALATALAFFIPALLVSTTIAFSDDLYYGQPEELKKYIRIALRILVVIEMALMGGIGSYAVARVAGMRKPITLQGARAFAGSGILMFALNDLYAAVEHAFQSDQTVETDIDFGPAPLSELIILLAILSFALTIPLSLAGFWLGRLLDQAAGENVSQ